MATYTFPVSGNVLARSTALTPDFLLPDFYQPQIWASGASGLTGYTVSGVTGGFYTGVSDGNGGIWAVGLIGPIVDVTASGAVNETYNIPPNRASTGLSIPASGGVYAIDSAGELFTTANLSVSLVDNSVDLPATLNGASSYSAELVNSSLGLPATLIDNATQLPFGFGALSRGLIASGSTLYTILPAQQSIGTYDLATGASGAVSGTMTNPSCFAISASGVLGVCGWADSTLMNGFTQFSMSPMTMGMLVGLNTPNNQLMMLMDKNRTWMVQQTISINEPDYLAWTPNAEQLFVNSSASGVVQLYNMDVDVFNLAQTFTLSDAGAVTVTPNSLTAFVCQTPLNQITLFNASNNIWASGATIAINGPTDVYALSNTQVFATIASGFAYINEANQVWSVGASGALSYTPTTITQDEFGILYVAGSSSTTGYLTAIASGVVLGGSSWAGSADDLLWIQGQLCVTDSTNSLVRIFGLINGQFTQMNTAPAPMGSPVPIAVTDSGESIFVGGSTMSYQYQFAQPFTLQATQTSTASLYVSGGWNNTVLGISERPSACTFDDSGNLWVATQENNVYEVNTGGIVSSQMVPQYGQQPQITPIGLSSLMWNNGHLYATSCLEGGIVEVV